MLLFKVYFCGLLMLTDGQIKGKILHKLTRKGKFEHSHTALDNLQKGFSPEIRGRAKDMAEDLIREGILHLKKTSYGKQVSVNVEMKEKIMEYIDEFLKMD